MPQLVKNPYLDVSADDIEKTYRDGYITAQRKNEIMRKKAEAEVQQVLGDNGYLSAVMTQMMKNFEENWEALKKIASTPEKDITVYNDLKNGFKSAWYMAQWTLAPLNAFGEVNGAKAEQVALMFGASPGMAKVMNIAADVGSGFLPIGVASRQFVKGAQAIGKEIGGKAATKGAEAAAKTAANEAKAAEEFIEQTIKQGLEKDGVIPEGMIRYYRADVEGAPKVGGTNWGRDPKYLEAKYGPVTHYVDLPKSIVDPDDYGVVPAVIKLTSEQMKGAKPLGALSEFVGPPSAQEQFLKSLRTYKREMEAITDTKTHQMTLNEASKLGLGIDDLRGVLPGTALKESEMAAYLKALDGPVDDLIELSKGVISGKVEGHTLGKAFQEFFEYSPKFRAAEVTAGRSVEILKETPPMKGLTDLMVGWNAEAMAKMDPQAVWKTLAEDILALADDTSKLKSLQVQGAAEVAKSGFAKWWSYGREAYINLLLARPVTQVRNFLGNSFAAVNSSVERELAGWLSIDQAKGVVRGEGMQQFHGMMAGIGDGISSIGKAFGKVDPDDLSKLDYIPHQIPGLAGRIINLPGDALRGMDNFFKTVLTRGDYYATALEHGTHIGLKGDALADYVTRRVNMPTSAMRDHAKAFALEQTFANDLGTLGKAAQKMAQTGPLVYWFPFMKTPMNLAKYAWNRTPGLQLLSKSLYEDIMEGGTKADMAIARLTLSNMTGAFWYGMAQQGLLTGGGPADPTLKRAWRGTKEPYSIMGPDGWYPITGIEPATTPLALIADFAEIHNQLDEPSAEQVAMAISLAGVRDIVDKSYWQSVGQFVDFLGSVKAGEEPGQKFLRFARAPAVTALSGGPLTAGIERVMDPVTREARGFVDEIRSKVPGYGKEMPPMRDGYGDPVIPPQPLGSAWMGMVSPFVHRPEETDAIKKEGARLNARLPQFPWSTGGGKLRDDFDVRAPLPGEAIPVELTPEQRDRWQVIYRNIIRNEETGLPALMESDQYKNSTWAAQREAFLGTLASARDGAKAALLTEDIDLAKRVAAASSAKYLPMLNPEDRPTGEAAIQDSLDVLENVLPQQRENLLKYGILESGKERDDQVLRLNVEKSIPELNAAAQGQGASHPVQMEHSTP